MSVRHSIAWIPGLLLGLAPIEGATAAEQHRCVYGGALSGSAVPTVFVHNLGPGPTTLLTEWFVFSGEILKAFTTFQELPSEHSVVIEGPVSIPIGVVAKIQSSATSILVDGETEDLNEHRFRQAGCALIPPLLIKAPVIIPLPF